jgi:hypothetical protein
MVGLSGRYQELSAWPLPLLDSSPLCTGPDFLQGLCFRCHKMDKSAMIRHSAFRLSPFSKTPTISERTEPITREMTSPDRETHGHLCLTLILVIVSAVDVFSLVRSTFLQHQPPRGLPFLQQMQTALNFCSCSTARLLEFVLDAVVLHVGIGWVWRSARYEI